MRIKAVGLAAIVGSALLFLSLPAFADEVSVEFTGGYTTTFANSSGDFGAGIYTATINGAASPGIICDDFNDEITAGETWNAKAYQASSLASGNIGSTLFGSTIGLTGYAEVGTLVNMMFGNIPDAYGGITGITQSEIASAIWDITTPGGISGLDIKADSLVTALDLTFDGNIPLATTYLDTLTDLWILTPDPLTGVGSGEPQEMWTESLTPAPEPSSLLLLGAGLLALVAMGWRRNAQSSGSVIS
jgi:PEP-CTERM motif